MLKHLGDWGNLPPVSGLPRSLDLMNAHARPVADAAPGVAIPALAQTTNNLFKPGPTERCDTPS